MEIFKETTEIFRKVLILMANRKNPFDIIPDNKIQDCIQKNKFFTDDLIRYMIHANFLKGNNPTFPTLSSQGLNLAQDISNDAIWNEAVIVCETNGVYSLSAVEYAIKRIIQKRIDKDIE